jgi:hypothetical protein
LSSPGIKVPCREPWENKSFKRRKTLHGNQEESRQEKETLSGQMLVQKFPKASPEKHLLRGFSIGRCCGALATQSSPNRQNACATAHLHF